jgi:hypothetical protein
MRVARNNAVAAVLFQCIEGTQDGASIQLRDAQGCRLDPSFVLHELEQQAESATIAG